MKYFIYSGPKEISKPPLRKGSQERAHKPEEPGEKPLTSLTLKEKELLK